MNPLASCRSKFPSPFIGLDSIDDVDSDNCMTKGTVFLLNYVPVFTVFKVVNFHEIYQACTVCLLLTV